MIIITNIYAPNKETEVMQRSFAEQGYEVAAISEQSHHAILKQLWECYKRAATGHELFIYSDGADTFCQRKITKVEEKYLSDKIVYSAEKACWPIKDIADQYPESESQWKYLNGGNYGGPLKLIIEFFEKYELNKLPSNINGQFEQAKAFLAAKKDGFPIELDYDCRLFQTTAFDPMNDNKPEESAFQIVKGKVKNKVTKKTPAILHANGRSPMGWYWDLHDWTK